MGASKLQVLVSDFKIKVGKKKQERSQCLCAEENHETIWGVDAQSKF